MRGSLAVIVYTDSTQCQGRIWSEERRLSDCLNNEALHEKYFPIQEAILKDLAAPPGARTETLRFAQIRRDAIILVQPLETSPSRQPAGSLTHYVKKVPHLVSMRASPFTIDGTLHLPHGTSLEDYLRDSDMRFIPVTEARVSYLSDPVRPFDTPVILLHKAHLQILLSVEAASPLPKSPPPPAPTPGPLGAFASRPSLTTRLAAPHRPVVK
jgi:hypothetical protein